MTVLFCPLDWGLGHIARDLPLIRWFHEQGHRVVVAASPKIESWLQKEFPGIETTRFDGPEIRYSRHKHLLIKLTLQLPKLMQWPGKEKKRTEELVNKFNPGLIVSDNRYGARHPDVFSVIITHQLMIKMPGLLKWTEWPVHNLIRFLLNKFDEVWVPDFPKKHSLAGDLVHKYPLPAHAKLIGPLSRFHNPKEPTTIDKDTPLSGILAIISGPEPQRSLLERELRKNAPRLNEKTTLITGIPAKKTGRETKSNNLDVYSHLSTDALQKSIKSNRIIIARAGYSTIMDMYYLGRQIWLVPTPGQTEQLYLADYHQEKGHITLSQNRLFEEVKKIREKPFHRGYISPNPVFRAVLSNLLHSDKFSSKQKQHSSQKRSRQ
ncbi:MAG: glycosyltransferase [Bacteroidota bacterium]